MIGAVSSWQKKHATSFSGKFRWKKREKSEATVFWRADWGMEQQDKTLIKWPIPGLFFVTLSFQQFKKINDFLLADGWIIIYMI